MVVRCQWSGYKKHDAGGRNCAIRGALGNHGIVYFVE